MASSSSSAAANDDEDELSRNLRDQFLQCKICLDGLKEPKTLPCLHTFCAQCIVYYVEYNRLDQRKFSCPICRRHIYIPKDGIDGFPDSFFVESLNDVLSQQMTKSSQKIKNYECNICRFKEGSVQAKMMCVECKVELCDNCSKVHNEAKVTEGHTLLRLLVQPSSLSSSNYSLHLQQARENYCRIHKGEIVKYYCQTCNSPICLPCTFLDHKDHSIEEIKVVRHDFGKEMTKLVMNSQDNMIQLKMARDDLVELENELFTRKESVKTQIRRTVQDLIRSIQENEHVLMMEVDSFYDTLSVATDRQRVEKIIFRLQRANDFAEQLLSKETSPITQLVNRTEAKENLEQAQTYQLPDIRVHAEKMNRYLCYLPCKLDSFVGSVIQCASEANTNTMILRVTSQPTNKALFLHKCRLPSGQTFGEILSISFLPLNNDVVLLTTEKKFIKILTAARGILRYEFGGDDDDDGNLEHPSDLVVTRDGEIAVTDCGHLCVKVFDSFGVFKFSFGDGDLFSLPVAICVDFNNRFIVCDQVRQRLTIHRNHGDELVQIIDIIEVLKPEIILCFCNKIYVCDVINGCICIYSEDEGGFQLIVKFSSSVDGRGGSEADFLDCSGIAIDRTGNLIISDAIACRFHMINRNAEMSNVVTRGRSLFRPGCIALSNDAILAVTEREFTIDTKIIEEEDAPVAAATMNEGGNKTNVCIYRLIRSDV